MSALPAYRRIHLRLLVRAAVHDSTAVAADLGRALERHGAVEVIPRGPYHRDEGLVEFDATLTPAGRVGACVAALTGTATGWDDTPVGPGWVRSDDGTTFLHPRLEWATLSPEEAHAPPRFVVGDLVRVLDCPAARAEGIVGVRSEICGSSHPLTDDDVWGYAVRPSDWTTLICFDEPQLAPAGHPAAASSAIGSPTHRRAGR